MARLQLHVLPMRLIWLAAKMLWNDRIGRGVTLYEMSVFVQLLFIVQMSNTLHWNNFYGWYNFSNTFRAVKRLQHFTNFWWFAELLRENFNFCLLHSQNLDNILPFEEHAYIYKFVLYQQFKCIILYFICTFVINSAVQLKNRFHSW